MNNKKLLAMALMVMGAANAMNDKHQYKKYKDAMFAHFDAENNKTPGMTKGKVTPFPHTKEEKLPAYHTPKSSNHRTDKAAMFAHFDAENNKTSVMKEEPTPLARIKEEEKLSAYPKSSDHRTKAAMFAHFDAENNKTSGMTKGKTKEEEEKLSALSRDEVDVGGGSLKKPVNSHPLYKEGYKQGRKAMQDQIDYLQGKFMNTAKDLDKQVEAYKQMKKELKDLKKKLKSEQEEAQKIKDSNTFLGEQLTSLNEIYDDTRGKLDELRKEVKNLDSNEALKTLKDKVAAQIEQRSETGGKIKKVLSDALFLNKELATGPMNSWTKNSTLQKSSDLFQESQALEQGYRSDEPRLEELENKIQNFKKNDVEFDGMEDEQQRDEARNRLLQELEKVEKAGEKLTSQKYDFYIQVLDQIPSDNNEPSDNNDVVKMVLDNLKEKEGEASSSEEDE